MTQEPQPRLFLIFSLKKKGLSTDIMLLFLAYYSYSCYYSYPPTNPSAIRSVVDLEILLRAVVFPEKDRVWWMIEKGQEYQ